MYYQRQAVGQGEGVRGPGCVLDCVPGEGAFPLHMDGSGERERAGMTSLVVGPGRAETWRPGRAGCALGPPSGKGLAHSGQRLWMEQLLPKRGLGVGVGAGGSAAPRF